MGVWDRRAAQRYELVFESDDHVGEAKRINEIVQQGVHVPTSLLDVACGTGWHLQELRRWYRLEGVDLSPSMLEFASARLPGVPLHVGDMRSFDLGRTFDAVICLSSSIAHMLTVGDLRTAIANMARHVGPRGVLIVEPWPAPGEDPDESKPWVRVVQKPDVALALMETTRLVGDRWEQETHYLQWTSEGIEHVTEQETLGSFTRQDHFEGFREAGLKVTYDPVGLLGRGLYVGQQPA